MPLELNSTPRMAKLAQSAASQSPLDLPSTPNSNKDLDEAQKLLLKIAEGLEQLTATSGRADNAKLSERAIRSIEGLQSAIADGRNPSAIAIEKALRALGDKRLELADDFQKFSQDQQRLVEKVLKDLNRTTRFVESQAPRTHVWAKRAGAGVADHFGMRNYYDAIFGSAENRQANGYRGRISSLARAFAGNRGMGDLFDSIFMPVAGNAGGGRSAQNREYLQSQQKHLEAMETLEEETAQLEQTTSNLDSNVVQLRTSNDSLRQSMDKLREEFATDSKERARQAILDRQARHEAIQSTNVLKFPGHNRAQSMLDKTQRDKDGEGGLLGSLLGGILAPAVGGALGLGGAAAGGAAAGGLAATLKRYLPRLGGGRGKIGLLLGLLGLGGASAGAAFAGSGEGSEVPTPSGNGSSSWEPQILIAPGGMAPQTGSTSGNSTPQQPGTLMMPQNFVPNAVINDPPLDPNATGENAWMAQPGNAHGKQIMLLEPSSDGSMYRYMDKAGGFGSVGTRLIQPLAGMAVPGGIRPTLTNPYLSRNPNIGVPANSNQVASTAQAITSEVTHAQTGRRIASNAAKTLGKGLSRALGPVAFVLEAYSEYEYLQDLYGMRLNGEITEAEFQTEFYASLAGLLGGPAGAAIGAKLGAVGGGAAGAFVGGVGAGPGALAGGIAGGLAGWFGGKAAADFAARQIMGQINGSTGVGSPPAADSSVTPSSTTQSSSTNTAGTGIPFLDAPPMPGTIGGWIGGGGAARPHHDFSGGASGASGISSATPSTQLPSTFSATPNAASESAGIFQGGTGRARPDENVTAALERAAQDTGMDPRIIWGKASVESNYNANASAGTLSSARGLGQILRGTWDEIAAYPEAAQYGIVAGDYNARYDPYKSAVASMLYSQRNINKLKEQGLLTDEMLQQNPGLYYLPHNLGTAGAARFLRGMQQNPNGTVDGALTSREIRNNPSIYTRDGRILTYAEALSGIEQGKFGQGFRLRQEMADGGQLPATWQQDFATTQPGSTQPGAKQVTPSLGMVPVKMSDGSTQMVDLNDPNAHQGQAFGGRKTHNGTFTAASHINSALGSGVNRFTGFNDNYHAGTGSKHASGLAGDFTVQDGQSPAEAAQRVRDMFSAAGLREGDDFRVLDEYANPSARATGGHIHYQFQTPEAAQRYLQGSNTPEFRTQFNIPEPQVPETEQPAEAEAISTTPQIQQPAEVQQEVQSATAQMTPLPAQTTQTTQTQPTMAAAPPFYSGGREDGMGESELSPLLAMINATMFSTA